MKDFEFRFIGHYDTSNILQKLNQFEETDWDRYTYRQDTYETHKQTKAIPLIYDVEYSHIVGKKTEYYNIFKDDIINLDKILKDFYHSNGEIIRVEIVKMSPGSKIRLHYDNSYSLKIDNRIHLPIITNENVIFTVGDTKKNMKINELWEINNSDKLHGVINGGTNDRIHMIIDFKFVANTLI